MRVPRPRIADPGLASLKSAARTAIVLPAVFALAFEVIQNGQTDIFAAFGSFAMLVFVEFRGSARSRLAAYLTLGLTGAVLVVIGTLCAQNSWLAAGAMAVVGFVILSSGAINGYFAAGATAALLSFVLSVAIPAPLSDIPARLAGWGLAAGACICAVMLLWPPRQGGTLRGEAARTCLILADLADVVLSGNREATESRVAAAAQAVEGLHKRYEGSPHRPTGPSSQAAALGALVDELAWLLGSLRAVAGAPEATLCSTENSDAMAAVAAALRASGGRLAGRDERPDAGQLEAAQEALVQALARQVSQLPPGSDDAALDSLLGRSFRTRAISYTARQIAIYALAASDAAAGLFGAPVLVAVRQFAGEHASIKSVSFRNSVRGAAGLAVAVFIAQRSGLQHSFWVVLGTLSVLRSNALGTGRSILGALAGTAAGIVIGALVIVGLGASTRVLWGVLPVAVLIAAYAPRVISFAVGQAAFTIVLLVLYNIIAPVGWRVGLVRIEDVAIGFAVSLGVGLVFWPRGSTTVLRENLATAYSRSADYVVITARLLTGRERASDPHRAEQIAAAAVHRLDDAFRQYLAERSAKRTDPESTARMVAGASRVLRAGHSMEALSGMAAGETAAGETANGGPGQYGQALDDQVQALRAWYVTLGDSLANGTSVPRPQAADPQDRSQLMHYVRDSIADGDAAALHEALVVLWASQHLDMLRRLEAYLSEQAVAPAPG